MSRAVQLRKDFKEANNIDYVLGLHGFEKEYGFYLENELLAERKKNIKLMTKLSINKVDLELANEQIDRLSVSNNKLAGLGKLT